MLRICWHNIQSYTQTYYRESTPLYNDFIVFLYNFWIGYFSQRKSESYSTSSFFCEIFVSSRLHVCWIAASLYCAPVFQCNVICMYKKEKMNKMKALFRYGFSMLYIFVSFMSHYDLSRWKVHGCTKCIS